MKSSVLPLPYRRSVTQRRSRVSKSVRADPVAQRLHGHRAPDVDRLVEEPGPARVGDRQVPERRRPRGRDSQLASSQSCGEAKPRWSSHSISSQLASPSLSQMSRQPPRTPSRRTTGAPARARRSSPARVRRGTDRSGGSGSPARSRARATWSARRCCRTGSPRAGPPASACTREVRRIRAIARRCWRAVSRSETARTYGVPLAVRPRSSRKSPAAKNARYGAIGCRLRQCQPVQCRSTSRPTSRPLATACRPRGTRTCMSKVALSRGWSLAGNHQGAMCGSPMVDHLAGVATQGRSPAYAARPGRPW